MNILELADGGRIAYAEAGEAYPRTPPVILLHAGYLDHRMWERELAHLGARGLTVAPDARTHGGSSNGTAPFRHCDDVAALVRHLGDGRPRPAVLIGVSMGAATAVDTALEHPELVRALIVSGAGTSEPTFEEPWELSLLARQEQAIADRDPAAWLAAAAEFAAGPQRTLDDVDPAVLETVRRMQLDFVAGHVRPGVLPPTPVTKTWERLAGIDVPVLGIVGEFDGIDHHRMCDRAVGAVRDGRGVRRIAGAGHFPNLEQPGEWERLVDDFLDTVL